jgi:RNA polymerase sigma-70 factor (ECF subfamily)
VAAAVLERFRQGDRSAFLEVYAAHASDLRGLVARFFASPFEREEATQEVWLQAHRMAAMYNPERGALLTWLRALAINRCTEILRSRGRRPDARAEIDEDALVAGADHGGDPHRTAQQHRIQQAVQSFAGTLSREEAAVFQQSLLEDRPHHEVARMIGISVRRCKYLRKKLLARAAADERLAAVLVEVGGGETP